VSRIGRAWRGLTVNPDDDGALRQLALANVGSWRKI
jgi:hypothetical protein